MNDLDGMVVRSAAWNRDDYERSRDILLRADPSTAWRGMTQTEYDATVGAGGDVQSRGDYSFSVEGTMFSEQPASAEDYVNFGRDDPRITGRPTYLVEVKREMLSRNRQGDWQTAPGVALPRSEILRVYRMEAEGDDIVAHRVMTENSRRKHLGDPCIPGPLSWAQLTKLTPNRATALRGSPAMKTTFGRDIDPDEPATADLDSAMDRYETFHAKRPLRIVELEHDLPSKLVPVGEAVSTMYRTDKWHDDGNDEDYKHVHDKGEDKRYDFGDGVVVYEPATEIAKSRVNGRRVSANRHEKAVTLPVGKPKALPLLGYCLGFFVRRYDDGKIYEVNPRGSYLFCSPTGNMLAVYSPEKQSDGSRGFLALMAGGKLRVLKDGIDG